MKTTGNREKTEQGERVIYSAPGSRILAWEGYGFIFSPSQFFVVTDISPHFPGIKNPFWIIHSILNLAGTCIHNKLNLLRRCWDLSWMCRWQTTKILSFIFNMTAAGRVTVVSLRLWVEWTVLFISVSPHCHADIIWILKVFSLSHHLWKEDLIAHSSKDSQINFKAKQRPLHWTATHDSHQNRERSASHFLMVTRAMMPGNWTVGILSVHHMTCLKSL